MNTTSLILRSSGIALVAASLIASCSMTRADGAKDSANEDASTASEKTPVAKPEAGAKDKAAAKTAAKPAKPTPATANVKPLTAPTKPVVATAAAAAPRPTPVAEEKLIRYVSAELLNVHTSPRMDSPVVAKIKRGSMFTVSLSGDWAKVSDGQFVLARYLTPHQGSSIRVVMEH